MTSSSEVTTGRIVKALSGYYYVMPEDADASSGTIQCRARGIFKKKGLSPLVGDRVVFSRTENGEGMVDEILPRRSELIRPPVANVELAVLVFSVSEPALNLQLLDKFLVHIEHAGIDAVLCLSKQDLTGGSEPSDDEGAQGEAAASAEAVERIYRPIGYEIYHTSSRLGEGMDALNQRLAGHLSVFAGQSGVGKSSLLNAIVPGLSLETNEISSRLGRGKHTTRHVELIEIGGGGLVADTPGFSQLDFTELGVEELSSSFREFRPYAEACKFRGCTHVHEPGCKVLEAYHEGAIEASRYDHYVLFLTEMKEKKRRY
ncbi:ribosome small subunit-dependent GTPase A [Paenibacillus abyssi]|uniref:Small ribosomal subunit biogenesis GTPase RsgA n=1 Tax=Paenibacillus abyssi TaxID=1340531 RepID=A0A917D8G1_9BACL|nr:ribosome small subunit-dependent GTPase A [Paenibacillus abyssi]GGG12881.1 putative ribosome biogenesis GTPase RsgA [Paenibacillus abyssi]